MVKWFKRWRANKIQDENKREKELATIDGQAWVKVIQVEFTDPTHPSIGSMELDWNDAFIEMLKENEYSGRTDEEIVDMWFRDLCRGVIENDQF